MFKFKRIAFSCLRQSGRDRARKRIIHCRALVCAGVGVFLMGFFLETRFTWILPPPTGPYPTVERIKDGGPWRRVGKKLDSFGGFTIQKKLLCMYCIHGKLFRPRQKREIDFLDSMGVIIFFRDAKFKYWENTDLLRKKNGMNDFKKKFTKYYCRQNWCSRLLRQTIMGKTGAKIPERVDFLGGNL